MRDGSCRVSGCREQVQAAHVVDSWKRTTAIDMSRYNTGSAATPDDKATTLLAGTDGSMWFITHLPEYPDELEASPSQSRAAPHTHASHGPAARFSMHFSNVRSIGVSPYVLLMHI
tara:strand:- start:2710 stop:3057 length:348 start_codon:yes stop_codon:yes gene_type:complete